MEQPKIIGIGGTNASGKDTLAQYLVAKHGYLFISASDMVREIAMQREGNILRPTLHKIANQLRAERGGGVLVDLAIEHFYQSDNKVGLVIASLRTKGEVDSIHKSNGIILFIDADINVRYNRIASRKRADDSISFDEFVAQEGAEWHQSDNPTQFSMRSVKESADYCFMNTEDTQSFLDEVTSQLGLNK